MSSAPGTDGKLGRKVFEKRSAVAIVLFVLVVYGRERLILFAQRALVLYRSNAGVIQRIGIRGALFANIILQRLSSVTLSTCIGLKVTLGIRTIFRERTAINALDLVSLVFVLVPDKDEQR